MLQSLMHILFEIFVEVLLYGTGYAILRAFGIKEPVENLCYAIGILFWIFIAAGGLLLYKAIPELYI